MIHPADVLIHHSLALYSNWFYYKPARCLFDAGEGVATALGKKVFAIQHVFISHGHEDHISGIANLVNVRNLVAGQHDKPLNIYYPRHDKWVNALLEYVEKKQSGLLRYPLYVQPVEPGDQIELANVKKPSRVNVFETNHARAKLCLGFEIEEERRGIDPATGLAARVVQPVFFYSGDGCQSRHVPCGRVDIAIHEATFLERDAGEAACRVEYRHCTVESAVEWGASQDVKVLVLSHVSDRYRPDEIVNAASEAARNCAFRGALWVAYRDQLLEVR